MFTIRPTNIHDTPSILFFIRELASYEKLLHEVTATEKQLQETLFGKNPQAEVILGLEKETPIGFALFFPNYSTFLGRSGIHLEDLFVLEKYRGKGCGKALLKEVARIAVQRHAGRLEWNVLDWNLPAIQFYKHIGAKPMNDWTTFRLSGTELASFSEK